MSDPGKPLVSRMLSLLGFGAAGHDRWLATQAGAEQAENRLKMTFCWCPPGTFTMGSPPDEPERCANEGPAAVTLTRGFWLGKYEVTQGEWKKLMGRNPSMFSPDGKGKGVVAGQETSRHPVETVSWLEALGFCQKLTEKERGGGRVPAGWIYRLPTEAEWEYGCRAGTTSATAFGNALSSRQANFDGEYPYNHADKGPALRHTAPVGSFPANPWGLCDMHGNVSEWCQDWHVEELPGGSDPEAATTNGALIRTVRGGSAVHRGQDCRSAERSGSLPSVRSSNLGFRVAAVQAK